MEISGPGFSNNLLYRNNARNSRPMELTVERRDTGQAAFPVQEDLQTQGPDFTAITPRDMRDIALQSYHSGQIGADEYEELSAELPLHTIDSMGEVVDLSGVTDDTSFDFIGYFSDRHAIAQSIGDPEKAGVLQSVIDFMAPPQS